MAHTKSRWPDGAALAYARRWSELHEAQVRELREMAPAAKLERLATLMASAGALGGSVRRSAEKRAVRERWIVLRRRLLAGGEHRPE